MRKLGGTGNLKAWALAFVLFSGVGLGGLVGIGCAVGANSCPWRGTPKQTATGGRELYLANCAVCHGMDARGTRAGPSLTGEPVSLEALIRAVSRGKPLAGMPRFGGRLTADQIRAVAAEVAGMAAAGDTPSGSRSAGSP